MEHLGSSLPIGILVEVEEIAVYLHEFIKKQSNDVYITVQVSLRLLLRPNSSLENERQSFF